MMAKKRSQMHTTLSCDLQQPPASYTYALCLGGESPKKKGALRQEPGSSFISLTCSSGRHRLVRWASLPLVLRIREELEACVEKKVRNRNTCPPNGKSAQRGRRAEMEDAVSVVPSFSRVPCREMGGCNCHRSAQPRSVSDLHFFGVYDGHGGSQVSDYCRQHLHVVLAEEAMKVASSAQSLTCKWERAITECFRKMDLEVGGVCPTGDCNELDSTVTCSQCVETIAPRNVGSTAVVAIVSPCNIVVGNCGDSRAVLSRSGKAIALSRDHKPEREDELIRIEAAGGHVIDWYGYRVGALLAMSRSIGDRYLKEYVTAEPEVTCMERTGEDEFLILATDGLWDVLSNEAACDAARKCLARHRRKCQSLSGGGYTSSAGHDIPATTTANYLSRLALAKNSTDNISIVVVDLKPRQR